MHCESNGHESIQMKAEKKEERVASLTIGFDCIALHWARKCMHNVHPCMSKCTQKKFFTAEQQRTQ